MRKYSHFGVSFKKSFLVNKEANPVFYIAKNALDNYPATHARRLKKRKITRGKSFDASLGAYYSIRNELFKWVSLNGGRRETVPEELLNVLEEIMTLNSFLTDVFSYFKFFDTRQTETAEANFYMEREWPIRGELKFSLGNVYRIIIPQAYADRFHRDCSEYRGQITFSD